MEILELTQENLENYIHMYNFSETTAIKLEYFDDINGCIHFESVNGQQISIAGEIIVAAHFILLMGSSDFCVFIGHIGPNYSVMLVDSERLVSVLKNIENMRIKELDETTQFFNVDSSLQNTISGCNICYEQNVTGTSLECCNSKQHICYECLFMHTTNKFQEKYVYALDYNNIDNLKVLLSYKVPCAFCRTEITNYKYLHIFWNHILAKK
jgi:hypothetical protein